MGSKLSVGKSDSFFYVVACSAGAGKVSVSGADGSLQDTLKGLTETLGKCCLRDIASPLSMRSAIC